MPLRPLAAPTGTAWRAAATYPTSEPAPWRAAVAAACPSWPAPVQTAQHCGGHPDRDLRDCRG